jgi:hypothetical protein
MVQKMPLAIYIAAHKLLLWTVGSFVAILFTGGLITTGISCIFFLSTERDGPKRQNFWLRVFVLLLVLIVLAYQIVVILASDGNIIFYSSPAERQLQLLRSLELVYLTLGLTVISLTDGLLVTIFLEKSRLYNKH